MNHTIVIADDNSAFQTALEDFFDKVPNYSVVGVACDGIEACTMIEQHEPDILLLDIVMPELDGFGVLSSMALSKAKKRPLIVMMSQLCSDGFVSKALRNGADYFLAKPFAFETLEAYLNETFNPNFDSAPKKATTIREYPQMTARKPSSIDEKIATIFLSVGIPAHIKGYQFLREAIKMAVVNPEIINSITKQLYPAIANQFETSASKVERAIRHAIEVAWNRGKIENINTLFGIKVYSANEKPTNGEFIALVADKMMLEGA